MTTNITPSLLRLGIYHHFKGTLYEVLGEINNLAVYTEYDSKAPRPTLDQDLVVTHTETGEYFIVESAEQGLKLKKVSPPIQAPHPIIYARPTEMFLSRVDIEKYPFVLQDLRFEYMGQRVHDNPLT